MAATCRIAFVTAISRAQTNLHPLTYGRNDEMSERTHKLEYETVPCKEVNRYLEDGWNLWGSPFVIGSTAFQAITRTTL
jgi:hypothetical protein